MSGEAWAAIIGAMIMAVGTIIASVIKNNINIFKSSSRKIDGEWDGISYRINNNPDQQSEKIFECKQIVTIKQKGTKIKAEMLQTKLKNKNHVPQKFNWSGRLVGEYFIYETSALKKQLFLISNAMLYVHPNGNEMYGYFIANGGRSDPKRTWIGYTEMKKIRKS